MEAGRARSRDDSPRLPTLSLGLSSVQLIVNKLESKYTRVVDANVSKHRELVKYDPNIDEGYHDDSPLVNSRRRVLKRFAVNLGVALSRCVPSVTFGNFGVLAVTTGLFAPRMISYLVLYPFCRLVFGTLYPAYASYKAVRTKNLKEYVKWMMYWIVFALFTCTETFTDVFLSWFPFYYEVKIVLVLWLLSPATKGSSILYRKFVHPALCRREQEIDEYIAKAKDQGYHTVLNLGTKGVNYATTVIMQTAIKGGGGLVQQLRKSYSLSDLTECEPREERGADEADDVLTEPRLVRRGGKSGFSTRRSASESNSRTPMYFPEVDVDVRSPRPNRTDEPDFSHIKSTEDISSGYSSADNSASLARTASLGAAARARARASRAALTAIKRPQAAEESEVIIEELHDGDSFEYANMPPLVSPHSPLCLSHTDPPFLYQYVGDQVKIVQVLGNSPLNSSSNNETNNLDHRDQKEVTAKEASLKDSINTTAIQIQDVLNLENNEKQNGVISKNIEQKLDYEKQPDDVNTEENLTLNKKQNAQESEVETIPRIVKKDMNINTINNTNDNIDTIVDEHIETASFDTSINDIDTAESDDEASFDTPENSPKNKRKSPKGKYGKAKAPLPPKSDQELLQDNNQTEKKVIESAISQESLTDIVNKLPNASFKETGLFKGLQVVNPIAEKKRRHKSKSPGKLHKGNISGIGKLLQLPSKLAFWHRNDDKSESGNDSTSSGGNSRRSSTVENSLIDEFQSCTDLNALTSTTSDVLEIPQIEVTDVQISFIDATDADSENISRDIIEKSDALQKLIESKLESHPEYKYVSLHEEIPTTSKSTDV